MHEGVINQVVLPHGLHHQNSLPTQVVHHWINRVAGKVERTAIAPRKVDNCVQSTEHTSSATTGRTMRNGVILRTVSDLVENVPLDSHEIYQILRIHSAAHVGPGAQVKL